MATRLQQNLRFPLLYVLSKWQQFDVWRGRVDACIVTPLARLYNISEAERGSLRLPSGKKWFYNEVLRTKQILCRERAVEITPRSTWQVTESGLKTLRHYCLSQIKRMEPADLVALLASRDKLGQDWFVNLLRRISCDAIERSLDGAKTQPDLFLRALESLPIPNLGSFLWSASGTFELILRDHIRPFRHLTKEEREGIAMSARCLMLRKTSCPPGRMKLSCVPSEAAKRRAGGNGQLDITIWLTTLVLTTWCCALGCGESIDEKNARIQKNLEAAQERSNAAIAEDVERQRKELEAWEEEQDRHLYESQKKVDALAKTWGVELKDRVITKAEARETIERISKEQREQPLVPPEFGTPEFWAELDRATRNASDIVRASKVLNDEQANGDIPPPVESASAQPSHGPAVPELSHVLSDEYWASLRKAMDNVSRLRDELRNLEARSEQLANLRSDDKSVSAELREVEEQTADCLARFKKATKTTSDLLAEGKLRIKAGLNEAKAALATASLPADAKERSLQQLEDLSAALDTVASGAESTAHAEVVPAAENRPPPVVDKASDTHEAAPIGARSNGQSGLDMGTDNHRGRARRNRTRSREETGPNVTSKNGIAEHDRESSDADNPPQLEYGTAEYRKELARTRKEIQTLSKQLHGLDKMPTTYRDKDFWHVFNSQAKELEIAKRHLKDLDDMRKHAR